MSLIDMYVSVEGTIVVALGRAAVTILPVLIVVALVTNLWRYIAAVRAFGTANLTPARADELRRRSPSLKALQTITLLLGLVIGGIVIQAGYIAEGMCSCRGMSEYDASGGFLN